ncbi:MAG: hypothetical protein KJ621_20285 [Proteobacteria bacterium]|nr:hypothetical protein [Pseudomonadota bacterium]MBU1742369.1 hypothetical protein [Pseudomonadota bacterium]
MIDQVTGKSLVPARLPPAQPTPARPESEATRQTRCRLIRHLAGRAEAYGPDGRRLTPPEAMFVATYC